MYIKPFALEEWLKKHEGTAKYNLAESCVYAVSLDDFFAITRIDQKSFLNEYTQIHLDYGNIDGGTSELKKQVSALYDTVPPEGVFLSHGATEANTLLMWTLLSPGDHVITICPDYQQYVAVPESFGAKVDCISLKREDNAYLLPMDEIRNCINDKTKVILFSNPNNPTGAILSEDKLAEIIELAREHHIYIVCDEVYRQVLQDEAVCPSIADLYEYGISVGSLSKAFSFAGLRTGWIATRDMDVLQQVKYHSAYSMSSIGGLKEYLATKVLENKQIIIARNMSLLRVNLITLDGWLSQGRDHFSYVYPKAGSTVLIYYNYDIPAINLCCYIFDKTGTLITPGDMFGVPGSFRISYACDHRQLLAGLSCLYEVFEDLRNNPKLVEEIRNYK